MQSVNPGAMTDWKAMGADKKITAGICAILVGWLGVHKFIFRVTPKVFANFSPGLSFGNPGDKTGDCFCRNPEGIATGLRAAGATLSGLRVPTK
jgi:hypothetical protein